MSDRSRIDRRQLLAGLAAGAAGISALTASGNAGATHDAYDPDLKRGYTRTRFGLVHYWLSGGGPFLTLLHQASQSSNEFAPIAPYLADNYRVLAIDMVGHGRSDEPDHELTAEEYMEAAMAVLDDLGIEKTHLVGHHSGAMMAMGIAADHPERVDKVVLSGIGKRDEERIKAFFETPLTRDLPVDAEGDFLAKTWSVYRSMSAPMTPPEVTFLPFMVGLEARIRTYDAHYAILRWNEAEARARLKHTVLLLEGQYDFYVNDQEALLAEMPGSSREYIPDCGAFMFHEKPGEIAEVILRYLDA